MTQNFGIGILAASVVLLASPFGAIAQTVGVSDAHFAREAAIGGMTEVELGKLAVQKSSNDKIKEFGQRMVDDHSKSGDDLKSIAAKDNITLPSDVDAKHKAVIDRFSKMPGTEFDRAYARDMVRDHETDITDFEKEASSGTNADLKEIRGHDIAHAAGAPSHSPGKRACLGRYQFKINNFDSIGRATRPAGFYWRVIA